MKKWLVLFVSALITTAACTTPKAYYQTSIGKKKQKYYNSIQFGQKERPKMKF
ncbi:MAG: hypothetical protein JSS79_06675 [Bacteroidetes bacterium]|nr:hypothetical protein [Bacteroidota bacterium]